MQTILHRSSPWVRRAVHQASTTLGGTGAPFPTSKGSLRPLMEAAGTGSRKALGSSAGEGRANAAPRRGRKPSGAKARLIPSQGRLLQGEPQLPGGPLRTEGGTLARSQGNRCSEPGGRAGSHPDSQQTEPCTPRGAQGTGRDLALLQARRRAAGERKYSPGPSQPHLLSQLRSEAPVPAVVGHQELLQLVQVLPPLVHVKELGNKRKHLTHQDKAQRHSPRLLESDSGMAGGLSWRRGALLNSVSQVAPHLPPRATSALEVSPPKAVAGLHYLWAPLMCTLKQ